MGLQIKSSRVLTQKGKLAAAFFAVFALLVQPLVSLNIPSVFAMSATPETFFVRHSGDDSKDCLSYTEACRTLEGALDKVTSGAGQTIEIRSDLSASKQVTITKSDVTIKGAIGSTRYTLTPNFAKTSNDNNAAIGIRASNVTINGLKVNGANGVALHGINLYGATNTRLNNVDLLNNKNAGMIVGKDSSAIVTNITTANNGWYGINVDKKEGAAATLSVLGTSTHNEGTKPHIFIDNRSHTNNTVYDSSSQYLRYWEGAGYKYVLRTSASPVIQNVDASHVKDATYTGVYVGFDIHNLSGRAQSLEVRANRASGGSYSMQATPSLLATLNASSNPNQTSGGTLIVTGERSSGSWTPQTGTWTGSADITSVDVIITLLDGTTQVIGSDATIRDNGATLSDVFPAIESKVVVTGSTTDTENTKGEWMFNRDQATQSPFEFTTSQRKIGNGSLYAKPVSSINASDKFIGELFVQEKIADLKGVSFDYRLGDGVAIGKAGQFYMNVYANFNDSLDYGHCVYSVGAVSPAVGLWNTVSFNPTANYDVRTRGGSPQTCPASPAAMGASATIRAIAVTLGDTSLNDAGVHGYFDNVMVSTANAVTTYDFELNDAVKPTVKVNLNRMSQVTSGGVLSSAQNPEIEAYDNHALDRIELWKNGVLTGNVWLADGKSRRANIKFLGEGSYIVKVFDANGNQSDDFEFTVDNTGPDFTVDVPVTSANTSPKLTGSIGEPGVVITIKKDGVTQEPPVTINQDGTWSWSPEAPLTIGSHSFTIAAKDIAGNISEKTVDVSVIPALNQQDDATTNSTNGTDSSALVSPLSLLTPNPLRGAGQQTSTPTVFVATVNSGQSDADEGGEVLGMTDAKKNTAAVSNPVVEASKDGWKLFGLAWYWWIVIVTAIAAIWWLVAARRRKQEEV